MVFMKRGVVGGLNLFLKSFGRTQINRVDPNIRGKLFFLRLFRPKINSL